MYTINPANAPNATIVKNQMPTVDTKYEYVTSWYILKSTIPGQKVHFSSFFTFDHSQVAGVYSVEQVAS